MKKLFLSLAVLFSVAMVSCGGNKTEQTEEQAPAEEAVVADVAVVEDTVAPDSVQPETVVAVAAEQAAPAEEAK